MDGDTRSVVRLAAANLALVVGLLHVGLGALNWLRWARAGFLLPRDLRWPLFVVSGLALLAGLALAPRIRDRRPLYAGGIALALAYVVGYFGWHLGGHRPLLLAGPGTTHTEPLGSFLVAHLFAGPVEFVAIAAEVALAAALAYLLATGR